MCKYLQDLEFISIQLKEVYRQVILEHKLDVFSKALYDEVTNIDLEIERILIDRLRNYDDQVHILSEEFNSTADKKHKTWIIDPIDGTCNLTHGIPTYGVQCALFDEGETKLSAIYFPFSGELFTAVRGMGAKLNGNRICGANRSINRAVVSFGDFIHTDSNLFNLEHDIMRHVSGIVERIRMYGAASVDFAYAACGRIDANFTFVKNSWDIMPGLLLCEEAGLIVTDAYGKSYSANSETVAVFSTAELMLACTNTASIISTG